uniref:Ycf34 n=1 Tax=Leiomenia cribrosa TaxID=217483 RepID=A0A4D6WWE1_9FLOR|nr:hypothetical protein [Leiomenia cribrosa]
MCICINCRHVNVCNTYELIKNQHNQKIKKIKKAFIPKNTLIKININQNNNHSEFDWDLTECLSFIEQPGAWLT